MNLVLAGTLNPEARKRRTHALAWGYPAPSRHYERRRKLRRHVLGRGGQRRRTITSSVTPFLALITFDRGYFRKGVSREQVIVSGQGSEASCGLYFDEGETFLGLRVPHVGKGEDGPLKIGFCTASPALSSVEAQQRSALRPTSSRTLGVPMLGPSATAVRSPRWPSSPYSRSRGWSSLVNKGRSKIQSRQDRLPKPQRLTSPTARLV